MNNTEGFNDSERQKALRMSFIAGLFDVIITVAAFAFSNSSVLLADFLKTTIEFIAVLLSLLAMRKVCKGADSNFEYGLGKLENLSSMFVGTTMALSFMIITGMAFKNIIHPEHIISNAVFFHQRYVELKKQPRRETGGFADHGGPGAAFSDKIHRQSVHSAFTGAEYVSQGFPLERVHRPGRLAHDRIRDIPVNYRYL